MDRCRLGQFCNEAGDGCEQGEECKTGELPTMSGVI